MVIIKSRKNQYNRNNMSENLTDRIYERLGTKSRRALVKIKKKYGHPYRYSPRGDLLSRISTEFSLSTEEALNQLKKLRREKLAERGLSEY